LLTATIQVSSGELSVTHPSFRIISTASKSLSLRDWLNDEHANMFFPIPSQPMDADEENEILLETGCSPNIIKTLLSFAEKYRQSLSADAVQKNRKLGTRALVRIATRLARFPQDDDLNALISRSLLAEFLPAVERITLDTLLQEAGIKKRSAWVR
jgi:von Willebrand factor A domain-containing protein 8